MYNEVRGRNGERLFETNHGTLERHFELFVSGDQNKSNPTATIYVWAKALQRRALIDQNTKLTEFSEKLINAVH